MDFRGEVPSCHRLDGGGRAGDGRPLRTRRRLRAARGIRPLDCDRLHRVRARGEAPPAHAGAPRLPVRDSVGEVPRAVRARRGGTGLPVRDARLLVGVLGSPLQPRVPSEDGVPRRGGCQDVRLLHGRPGDSSAGKDGKEVRRPEDSRAAREGQLPDGEDKRDRRLVFPRASRADIVRCGRRNVREAEVLQRLRHA